MSVRRAVVLSYVLSIGFVICGTAIVFMRTRYAVAFYLVIFGSIIVAAYKMGMVHERPLVVKRRSIESSELMASGTDVEPGNVLEIRDDAPGGAFQ